LGLDGLGLDRQSLIFSLGLVVAVLLAYAAVGHNEFIAYDDPGYILDNAHVKAGLTWRTIKWAFLTNTEANWHPLTWLSHALDCDLFGLNPAGPHWENVALHAFNGVLVFWLLQAATRMRWRSLMVAALFALHPVNVESVAWAAERKNVLSMFFFLLAAYAYVRYTRQRAAGRYAAVAGLFALALLSKPQVITFPFVLLLLDFWPLRRFTSASFDSKRGSKKLRGNAASPPVGTRIVALVREKIPLFLLSAASAVVTVLAQSSGGAVKDLARYSFLMRIENAVISYSRYLGKAFWPVRLVALYPHPTQLYPAGQVAAAALLLLLVTALVCWRARQQPYLIVGWLWFLGTLVPMLGLMQVGEQAMADRYAYLSYVGLFVMVVWLAAEVAGKLRFSGRWLAVPAVGYLLVLAVLTYRQVGYWHDGESFWRRTLALTQNNYIAERNLAGVLHERGDDHEAILHLRAALAIRPDDIASNLYLGAQERSRGSFQSAVELYRHVAEIGANPRIRAQANAEIGSVYRQTGDLTMAREYFEASLEFVPNQPTILVEMGVMDLRDGNISEAVRQLQYAASLQHSDVGDLLLAHALQLEGRSEEASKIARRVKLTSPNLAAAQRQVEELLAGK
jgi:tetratricopeptide (TPR) repeat protein